MIKHLVPLEKVMEWSVLQELTQPRIQGMIFKKRELSLSHHQFVTCWRLNMGMSNQRQNVQFLEIMEKLKRSKVVGTKYVRVYRKSVSTNLR